MYDWVIELTRWMKIQQDSFNLKEIVCDDNGQEKKLWTGPKQTSSRSLIFFLSHFLRICWSYLVAFGKSRFQNFVIKQLFQWKFCVVQQDTITKQSFPTKNYILMSFVWPSETGNSLPSYNWLTVEKFLSFHVHIFQSAIQATSRSFAEKTV